MPTDAPQHLQSLISAGDAAAARLDALRPGCARFVVVVPIPNDKTWWLHRYEVKTDLLDSQVSKDFLQDYERKIIETEDEAVRVAGEWAKGFASFQHVIRAENPYP